MPTYFRPHQHFVGGLCWPAIASRGHGSINTHADATVQGAHVVGAQGVGSDEAAHERLLHPLRLADLTAHLLGVHPGNAIARLPLPRPNEQAHTQGGQANVARCAPEQWSRGPRAGTPAPACPLPAPCARHRLSRHVQTASPAHENISYNHTTKRNHTRNYMKTREYAPRPRAMILLSRKPAAAIRKHYDTVSCLTMVNPDEVRLLMHSGRRSPCANSAARPAASSRAELIMC